MSDYYIEQLDSYYELCAEQAYQDYMEYSFYEFLYSMKENCRIGRTYPLPSNLNSIKRFWEVA